MNDNGPRDILTDDQDDIIDVIIMNYTSRKYNYLDKTFSVSN